MHINTGEGNSDKLIDDIERKYLKDCGSTNSGTTYNVDEGRYSTARLSKDYKRNNPLRETSYRKYGETGLYLSELTPDECRLAHNSNSGNTVGGSNNGASSGGPLPKIYLIVLLDGVFLLLVHIFDLGACD